MAVVLRCEACAFIAASTFTLSHWGSISIHKRRKTRVLIDLVLDEREILPGAITISQSHLTHLRRHQSPQGVARSVRPHSVIFLGDMMDNGFSDIQITECMRSSSLPPFRPAHFSASYLGTRSTSSASSRSSPHHHPCRSTAYWKNLEKPRCWPWGRL